MSNYLQKIIYLTQTDYNTLANGGTVTHGSTTLTGLESDYVYLTDGGITDEDMGSYVVAVTNGGTGLSTIGTSGQVLKVNSAGTGLEWGSSGGAGTVTSVQVQATSPVQSSTSTAQTSTLNTTISLASAYGDTQNPYGSKTKNYVLAAPTSADGAPSFRALEESDIPVLGDYVNVTGDTMTGMLSFQNPTSVWSTEHTFLKAIGANNKEFHYAFTGNGTNMDIGYSWANGDGPGLGLRAADYTTTSEQGNFYLYAKKGSTRAALQGTPAGALTWNDRRVVTATNSTQIGSATKPVYVDSSGQVIEANTMISSVTPTKQKLVKTTVPNVTSVGSAPTLGTAFSVPNVTGNSAVTASKVTKTDDTFVKTISQASSTSSAIGTVSSGILTIGSAITAVGAVTAGTTGSASLVTATDVSATKVTLGTAFSIPNVTNVGSAPTLGTAISVATGAVASDGTGSEVVTDVSSS